MQEITLRCGGAKATVFRTVKIMQVVEVLFVLHMDGSLLSCVSLKFRILFNMFASVDSGKALFVHVALFFVVKIVQKRFFVVY